MRRGSLVLGLAVVAGLFAAAHPPMPADANFAGRNGRIAYNQFFQGPVGIYTTSATGEDEPTFLTTGSKPAWSPGGQRIVFQDVGGIFVIDADGDHREQVLLKGTQEVYDSPSWSPDGERITVIHELTTNLIHTFELMVMDANSANPEILMSITEEFANLSHPRWSPDGSKILATLYTPAGGPGDNRLITVDVQSHQQKRVTEPELQSFIGDWSPDGTQIVFGVSNLGGAHIYIASADGGGAHRVGDVLGVWPVWSPDGQRILFHADPGSAGGLRLQSMTTTGTDIRIISDAAGLDADWGALQVIDSVEFTQAIQQLQSVPQLKADIKDDLTPPVPIVADKPAVMRIILGDVPEQTDFIIEVSGVVNGQQQVTVDSTCSPELRRALKEGCLSVDFYFTPPEGIWTANVKVRDFTNEIVEEHDFRINSPAAASVTLDAVSVCHDEQPDGSWICGSQDNYLQVMSYLNKILPTANVYLQLTGAAVFEQLPPGTSNASGWWTIVLRHLKDMYFLRTTVQERTNSGHYYAGAVSNNVPTLNGLAGAGGHALAASFGTTVFGMSDQQFTVARMLAYAFGVRNTNTELPRTASAPGCYGLAGDPGSDWTHEDNLLHSETPDEAVEVGFDVAEHKALPGDEFLEITGACAPAWISPRTYNKFLSELSPGSVHSAAAPAGASGPHWLVRGAVDGTVTFGPLLQLDADSAPGAGEYTIEVLGPGDTPLAQRPFDPLSATGSDSDGPPYFSELVPVVGGAVAIRVLDPGDQEIGRIVLAGATPQVAAMASAQGATLTASWTIDDSDSSEHTSLVSYSTNGGATWEVIGEVAGTTVTLDTTVLAGSSDARIRVLVSDGVNTGAAESSPFAVVEKSPEASILAPGGGTYRAGSLVWLQAFGFDAEDGQLDGGSVTWTSSKDGALGVGASLPMYDLTVGSHTITMAARDSDNNAVTDTVTVSISNAPLVEGEPVGNPHTWGDNDCDAGISSRDNQALSRLILQQNALSQTQPCPVLGSMVSVSGVGQKAWGDLDCDGEITSRDGQSLLRKVLQQNALSQTQPCPVLGDLATTSPAAVPALGFRWRGWR